MGPLISADELMALRGREAQLVLLDCSFDLFDPRAGEQAHAQAHIPGARHVHLDRDLSGPKSPRGPVEGGRHPLPGLLQWAQRVGSWGISPDTAVVAYDDQGSPYAARAWWMLRWLGHERVAVLDGGRAAWLAAGGGLLSSQDDPPAPADSGRTLQAYPVRGAGSPGSLRTDAQDGTAGFMPTITAAELQRQLGRLSLVDARAAERFRGETEPLDTQAGHIPGAINRFFKDNLQPDGRFKPAGQLHAQWSALLHPGQPVVHQCGSGVTACLNLLAQAHAGLGDGVLYPGSWSEWSADPARPVARG